MRAWRQLGGTCDPTVGQVTRPVVVELQTPAQWKVSAGAEMVELTVGSPPERACMNGSGSGACAMDCDCTSGERCLEGSGLAGPFTACAVPCELDRDCQGAGACTSVADGLAYACEGALTECAGDRPCPAGFTCNGGACEADYTLGQSTRTTCDCDDDCDPGLRCVEPNGGVGERRCEAACLTAGGGWCTGAHICGYAGQDLSGLADTDAVCIWLGE
jgi:hypothetical protein